MTMQLRPASLVQPEPLIMQSLGCVNARMGLHLTASLTHAQDFEISIFNDIILIVFYTIFIHTNFQ